VPEEIEAKVRIADPEALRRTLAARGWPLGPAVLEINRLFDDGVGTLRKTGSALRVREERDPASGRARRALLTFKGPRRPGDLKRRDEFELTVEAAEPMVVVLEHLGYRVSFYYEKRREVCRVGECEVTLDEVPHLGWFAEVEGPTEAAVRGGLAAAGLDGLPLISDSYVALLSRELASMGRDAGRAAF
jgi:adenylate cyclase, class 2